MKQCPKCSRTYTDETLNFCLDDGEWLVGHGEPATAILHSTDAQGDLPTRAQTTTDAETEQKASLGEATPRRGGDKLDRQLFMVVGLLAIVALGGFAGYRYFNSAGSGQISSMAVMPFVNDDQNPDLEYLSDGMTETLMNSLSQLPGLSVKARSSVFRYKGKETDAQTIGKELGVQAILNGRVVKRFDNLTLFLELVDTNSGNRLWGGQYTEPTANLIALQNHVARDVSEKLRVKLSGADQKKLAKNYTENAEAYQLYLQGRYFLNKRTPEAFRQAIPFFERALATDPNYALAFTGLSDSYALLGIYGGGLPPNEAMPKAKESALKALALDAELAEAHESLAHVLSDYDFDFAGAEREYKRAIELNPNIASAHQWYGEMLTELGRFEEGMAEIQRALDLDPLSLIVNRVKGRNLVFAGKLDQGIDQLKRTISLDGGLPGPHGDLAIAYQIKGDHAESVEELARQMDLLGDKINAALARESFSKGGWRGFLLAMTDKSHRSPAINSFDLGNFYIALGEKDAAINALGKAYDESTSDLRSLTVDPRFEPIRNDPRFQELYRKVGLP
jgi:TolB-like protein/Flp pilus assembly protein TadD